MTDAKDIAKAAMLAVIAAGVTSGSGQAMAADMEKCYGVAAAGKNDCGNAKHSCQGQSRVDGDSTEWVYVPKGLCGKLAGGSLESE